jgi:quercetin dioxygenase-like cupin family protein
MTKEEWIAKLEDEGYSVLGLPTFPPNAVLPEHTHDETTVHIILAGELTLTDKEGTKTWHTDDRFEIPAGTTHRGNAGPEGCVFIAGVKAARPSS